MLRRFLITILSLSLVFFNVACESSPKIVLQHHTCSQINSHYPNTSSIEKSNYELVRSIFSASGLANNMVNVSGLSSTPLGLPIKVTARTTQGIILIEDWVHTDKEIEHRINEILSYPKLANVNDYPVLYNNFQQYVKTSLQSWIPDRDYPKIGYLPKELLVAECLGDKEITKYWPEASTRAQARYVALNFDDLVLNYELIWNDLLRQRSLTNL